MDRRERLEKREMQEASATRRRLEAGSSTDCGHDYLVGILNALSAADTDGYGRGGHHPAYLSAAREIRHRVGIGQDLTGRQIEHARDQAIMKGNFDWSDPLPPPRRISSFGWDDEPREETPEQRERREGMRARMAGGESFPNVLRDPLPREGRSDAGGAPSEIYSMPRGPAESTGRGRLTGDGGDLWSSGAVTEIDPSWLNERGRAAIREARRRGQKFR